MPQDFFDPLRKPHKVTLIDEATAWRLRQLITGCEACSPNSDISFNTVLDRVTGNDPLFTNYVLEIEVVCRTCGALIRESTLVEWDRKPDSDFLSRSSGCRTVGIPLNRR